MLTRLTTLACLGIAALAGPARAQDLSKIDGSLHKVPADTAFYASSLRLGEQLDIFLNSNAYKRLASLPAVRFAVEQAMKEAHKPGSPLGKFFEFMHASENRELAEAIHDLFRREVFVYGSENSVKFLTLLGAVNGAAQLAPIMAKIQGEDDKPPGTIQLAAALEALNGSVDDIVVPDLVIGFRLGKPDAVKAQLTRLEGVLKKALTKAPPPLRDRLKRSTVGGADVLAYTLDGSLVPWNKIPWDKADLDPDDYEDLIDKLKTMTVSVALSVKGDYLLLTLGADAGPVAMFGEAEPLSRRPEFAPLAKFADRRVVSIGYMSLKLAEATGTTAGDVETMVESAKEALNAAPISDKLKEAIEKDVETFAKELTAALPKPAATMGFSFLTGRGMEGYSYVFGEPRAVAGKPMSILEQLGGSPLVAAASLGSDATPNYKTLVKWIKVFYKHGEAAAQELAPEGMVEQGKAVLQQVLPYLQRFDDITGNQLLPALADGQTALVVDGKWTSKKWFPEVDQDGKDLPMLELGLVLGVSDADLLVKAFKGYRALVNDILNTARGFGAPIPEAGWPEPKTKSAGSATVYYWPVPQVGQDKAILPNIAVSKRWVTFSTSAGYAERLHTGKPLTTDLKKFAGDRPISDAGVVDFAGLIGVARPWIETFAVPRMIAEAPEDGPEGLRKADIAPQVKAVLDVLQCLKSYREVTYREGNQAVTRFETVVEDLR